MHHPILEVLDPGLGISFQDQGRCGWKRYGVPPGGAMDGHAARWANRLVGNAESCPVIEILLNGARFRALERLEIALTGATVSATDQRWHTRILERDEVISIAHPTWGVWSYLAVPGGFFATRWFGSVSIFPRGGLGTPIERAQRLDSTDSSRPEIRSGTGIRWVTEGERRTYADSPTIRVWSGPQWELFPDPLRRDFLDTSWQISPKCDRTGYRLAGNPLSVSLPSMPSEPVLPGSIQIPPDGQPIVTLGDGPTVGGYPKLGIVDPSDLSRLTQCRPGSTLRFMLVTETSDASLRDRDQL